MSYILTDEEYECAKKMLSKSDELFAKHDSEAAAKGLTEEQRKRLHSPSLTYVMQCREEIAFYEELKAGKMVESFDIQQLPRMLACLRIASGFTQQELAARLGKTEKQQKTSERHEFHGLPLKQIQQVLDVLPVDVTIVAEDVVTGLTLKKFQPKDFGSNVHCLQKDKGTLSEESLLTRLEEERADVTVDVAAILGKILRVNFTVKARILR